MSRTAARRSPASVIVVAGEDSNDRKVVREIVEEFCPGLGSKLVEIRDPVRLKSATGERLRERAATLVGKAKARATREGACLAGLLVHEDLDGVTGPAYAAVRRGITSALERKSSCAVGLALAAWETEAWLLLFPEAFEKLRQGWRVPASLRDRDTGRITSPKEELCRRLGSPRFRESDGADVLRTARRLGLLRRPSSPGGTNQSFDDFVADLRQWG